MWRTKPRKDCWPRPRTKRNLRSQINGSARRFISFESRKLQRCSEEIHGACTNHHNADMSNRHLILVTVSRTPSRCINRPFLVAMSLPLNLISHTFVSSYSREQMLSLDISSWVTVQNELHVAMNKCIVRHQRHHISYTLLLCSATSQPSHTLTQPPS
jgi:hypothetical protein